MALTLQSTSALMIRISLPCSARQQKKSSVALGVRSRPPAGPSRVRNFCLWASTIVESPLSNEVHRAQAKCEKRRKADSQNDVGAESEPAKSLSAVGQGSACYHAQTREGVQTTPMRSSRHDATSGLQFHASETRPLHMSALKGAHMTIKDGIDPAISQCFATNVSQ